MAKSVAYAVVNFIAGQAKVCEETLCSAERTILDIIGLKPLKNIQLIKQLSFPLCDARPIVINPRVVTVVWASALEFCKLLSKIWARVATAAVVWRPTDAILRWRRGCWFRRWTVVCLAAIHACEKRAGFLLGFLRACSNKRHSMIGFY